MKKNIIVGVLALNFGLLTSAYSSDLLGGLGLNNIPGADILGGGNSHNEGNKDKKHHQDTDADSQGKHHNHHDKSGGGLLGGLENAGKTAMGAVGGVQNFSTKVNDTMFAAPEKIAKGLGSGVDKIVSVEDQVIDATGMSNNIIGQTIKGIDHGVGDGLKEMMMDFATFEKLYMKYMMGSGMASAMMASVSKNIKANLQKQNIDPNKATPEQLSGALQTSLKAQGVGEKQTQDIMSQVHQGMATHSQSTDTSSDDKNKHHGGHHHHKKQDDQKDQEKQNSDSEHDKKHHHHKKDQKEQQQQQQQPQATAAPAA